MERCKAVLQALHGFHVKQYSASSASSTATVQWCIDANCAWSPSMAVDMLAVLQSLCHCVHTSTGTSCPHGQLHCCSQCTQPGNHFVHMVEQPFRATLLDGMQL